MRRKPPTRQPTSDFEGLESAFAELGEQQDKRSKGRRRRLRLQGWLDRRILIGFGVLLLILIADGVRRENREFTAELSNIKGTVHVKTSSSAPEKPAKKSAKLETGNVVITGAASEATIRFPDGGVVTLAENTEMEIRVMEYSRGGRWRDRSVLLKRGQCWSATSDRFGKGSELRVHTPSAVAAVRGTTLYAYHNPDTGQSHVACREGRVTVRGYVPGAGPLLALPSGTEYGLAPGYVPPQPARARPEMIRSFAEHTELDVPSAKDPILQRLEYALNSKLDPLLSVLGIGRCSWGVGSSNAVRRAAALEALRKINVSVAGRESYPAMVNPMTLEGMGIDAQDAAAIVKQFRGNAIDSYECLENGSSFRITARAKDRASTTYVLTPQGPAALAVDEPE